MHEQFEVQLSKEEYVIGLDALFAELTKLDPDRSRRIFERLAAVVLLLIVTGWLFPEAMTGLFFVIVGLAILEVLLMKFWTKSAHGVSYDPAVGPQLVEFNDERITDTSAARTRHWPWGAIRRIHDRDAALVLELVGWDMIVLPSRLWAGPEERQRFLDKLRSHMSQLVEEPISTTQPPSPMKADLFTLAAIGAFVDVCLIILSFVPLPTRRYGPLADQSGFIAAMLLAILVSGLLGYVAYRLAKAGLPRLHARSPVAASVLAHALIWAFAVWFGATALGWI